MTPDPPDIQGGLDIFQRIALDENQISLEPLGNLSTIRPTKELGSQSRSRVQRFLGREIAFVDKQTQFVVKCRSPCRSQARSSRVRTPGESDFCQLNIPPITQFGEIWSPRFLSLSLKPVQGEIKSLLTR